MAFLDSVERYVVTTTAGVSDWPGRRRSGAIPYDALAKLRQKPGRDILVPGSPTLVRWLLGCGLLDELNVVLPIVVGSGVLLFPHGSTEPDPGRRA